jgi:hypothetical protein
VGSGLADALRVADGDADGLAEWLAEWLALALGVAVVRVALGDAVGVAESLREGEDGGSVAVDEDVVQAETAAEASRVKMPKPTAVNRPLSLVLAIAVRTFMDPPHASGRRRTGPRKRRGP